MASTSELRRQNLCPRLRLGGERRGDDTASDVSRKRRRSVPEWCGG